MKQKSKQKLPGQPQATPPSKNRTPVVGIGIILFVILGWTFVSFHPSVRNGFTNWDDDMYVYQDSIIQHKSYHLDELFTKPIADNYHPLTMISLARDYQSTGLTPATYHWTNLILHLLNTLLVFIFIYLLSGVVKSLPASTSQNTRTRWYNHQLIVATIVSLFFGIHPLHVESVTWISERKDVLYTFFYLSALIVYLSYLKKPQWLSLISVFILFILSCLSKGVAITLPVVMLLLDYFTGRKITQKVVIEKIPFLVLSVVFGIVALKMQASGMVVMNELTILQRFIFACYGFVIYIVEMFAPLKLSTFYPYPTVDGQVYIPTIYYLAPVVVICILLLSLWALSKAKWILFGILFYFITVALVLQFISVGAVIKADRYTYVPYIGLYFIVGSAFSYLWSQRTSLMNYLKIIVAAALLLYAFILSNITYHRTQVWKDSMTLWQDALEKYPEAVEAGKQKSPEGKLILANRLPKLIASTYIQRAVERGRDLKDFQGALEDCDEAIKLYPGIAEAYGNRANAKYNLGDLKGAMEDYNKALSIDSTQSGMYFIRARINTELKNYNEAIADYDKAIQLSADNADFYINRGLIKTELKDYENAIKDFNDGIRLNPGSAIAYFNRGKCASLLGRLTEACPDWKQALKLENTPDSGLEMTIKLYCK